MEKKMITKSHKISHLFCLGGYSMGRTFLLALLLLSTVNLLLAQASSVRKLGIPLES